MDGRPDKHDQTVNRHPSAPHQSSPRAINRKRGVVHLWVPACLSGLLLVVFFPLILRLQPESYRAATGHSPGAYLVRWLLLTAGLFLASGLVYFVGAIRRRGRNPDGQPEERLSG